MRRPTGSSPTARDRVRLRYDSAVEPVKRKISVTLDADLLAELERASGSVSGQLNEALRAEVARRRRRAALLRFLDELEESEGPLDTPEDVAAMQRIEQTFRDLERSAADHDRRAS